LFSPSWWWHTVENLTDFTIGCATRCGILKPAVQNNFLFAISSQLFSAVAEKIKNEVLGREYKEAYLDRAIFQGWGFKE